MPPGGKHHSPTKFDPRSYIKPLPLKISDQKGIQIQARSDTNYNPVIPTREDVRKDNYERREFQLRNQGFQSRLDQPYKGIGDPFYLDEKKLILHALGQWEEGQPLDTSSSSESEDDTPLYDEKPNKKKLTPANFVLRRSKKGLNTLNKDVSRARGLIRNVRLGHGLFQLLRREREERTTAKRKEETRQRKEALTECQPPSYNSSSGEETDEDIDLDVDLGSYMASTVPQPSGVTIKFSCDESNNPPITPNPVSEYETIAEQSKSRVAFMGMNAESLPSNVNRCMHTHSAHSRTSRASSKKKLPPARPYTPQHSYIGLNNLETPERTSLFRQLCALNWLLEAMNVEVPLAMASITTCWSLREIGGSKTSVMKQQNEKKSEGRWKSFLNNQILRGADGYLHPDMRRRTSKHRSGSSAYLGRDLNQAGAGGKRSSLLRTQNRLRGRNMSGRNSVASAGSVTESQFGMEPVPARGHRGRNIIPEDGEISYDFETGTDFTEEEEGGKGALRYNYEDSSERDHSSFDVGSQPDAMSARSDRSSTLSHTASPHVQTKAVSRQPISDLTDNSGSLKKTGSPNMTRKITQFNVTNEIMPTAEEKQKILDAITRYEEDPRTHAFAHRTEKMSSKDLRADLNPHPKVTPAVLEYQASLPSNRVGTLALDQREKFSNITQEKALLMHDALEAKERQRLRVLQKKFLHMPTGGCSFHRALKQMRGRSAVDEEMRERRRHSSTTHQRWYIDLLQNIPEEMKKEWFFQAILDKLSKYGMVDSPKQSALKLLKVLEDLRDWEVCCPDIAAAIEYCRDQICEMSIDDYEEWFKGQFPTVLRPQTAPAANRNCKDKAKHMLGMKNGKHVPRSAPPGMARGTS